MEPLKQYALDILSNISSKEIRNIKSYLGLVEISCQIAEETCQRAKEKCYPSEIRL